MGIARKRRNHRKVSRSRLYETRLRPLKLELLSVPQTQAAIWTKHWILTRVSVVSSQVAIYFLSGNSLVNNTEIKNNTPSFHYAIPASVAVRLAPESSEA